MNPSIFISQRIPDSGPNLLKEKFGDAVEYNETDGVLPTETLIERAQGKNILLPLLTDKVDATLFDACPDLKMVANYAVGYNNIDIPAATERGIMVSNTPGVLDDTTADLAFALIMSTGRKIVASDKYMRDGKFHAWEPMGFLGQDITGSTLGIVGMGRIGQKVAERGAHGFGMKILYSDNVEHDNLSFEAQKVDLETLLKESDFVSLHVPLMDATHHLMSEKELQMMKNSAYLINTSRGPVVDEKALYEALKNNVIAGAGLDVYEEEPQMYPGLNELDNAILLPHIGSASIQTRQKMSITAANNIVDFVEGKTPRTLVNKDVLA